MPAPVHRSARPASADRRRRPIGRRMRVDPVDALRALGGTARWKQLRGRVGWRAVKRARAAGTVEVRGSVYCLTGTDEDRVLAGTLRGVRSHETRRSTGASRCPLADGAHGQPHRALRPNAARRTCPTRSGSATGRSPPTDVDGDVTDSAAHRASTACATERLRVRCRSATRRVRSGTCRLARAGQRSAAPARSRARIARDAGRDAGGRAENAFESCARAILLGAGIIGFEPQQVDPARRRRG